MQKKSLYIKHSWSVLLLLATLLGSCAEYESIFSSEYVPEGESASITLTVQLPDMMSMTRASGITPDNDQMSHVSDLWVATYSASTGKRSGVYRYTPNKVMGGHEAGDHVKIEKMKALSGANYVVAVANASLNKGLDVDGGGEKSLLELLDEADTWEKFKNIAVTLNGGPRSIQYSGAGIMMTGIYYEDHGKHDYQNYVDENDNPTPMIVKPGENEMPGCIQLRRVASYVKFNILVEEEFKDRITLYPISWQICNLPGVSYVHERYGNRNAADTEVKDLPKDYDGNAYHNSPVYEGAILFPTSSEGVSSFDFYQMENKHTGLADRVNTYNDRELEHTASDGKNTGWYKSLVEYVGDEIPATPNYGTSLSNNNASYVVVKAHLEYYYDTDDPECKPVVRDNAKVENNEQILRVGDAIYTIHLGYCEGEESAQRAVDFNCRRNTQYTYNVYIAGVDQIRVEAMKEDMTNGVEGTVTDVTGNMIKVDAHYGTFNIELSDADRMALAWRIHLPFGDSSIDMMCDENNDFDSPETINLKTEQNKDKYNELPNNQFYNWIQFRPTTSEKVLAHYPGDPRLTGRTIENADPQTKGEFYDTENILPSNTVDGVWYLETLKDVANFPHSDVSNDSGYKNYLQKRKENNTTTEEDNTYSSQFNTKRWYTVFVDEYVYEYAYNPDNASLTDNADVNNIMDIKNWGYFVNRSPRYVWIALNNFKSSEDSESLYTESAYIISQESIQTYYVGSGNDDKQALGVEATNESYNKGYGNVAYGKNKNDTDLPSYTGGYSESDGLLNMYNYVRNGNDSRKWYQILADANGDFTEVNDYNTRTNRSRESNSNTYSIPDHEQTFMAACLARNRDLNNDGIIGANEIRWYLPTSANYIRITLGSVSLRNPLFNFAEFGMDDIQAGVGSEISHFAGSNNRMVWAEELAATSNLYEYSTYASNFRCIRNLGQPMNLVPDNDADTEYHSIDPAYKHDQDARTIELKFYDMSGLRDYTPGFISAHSVADIRSYPSEKFQYAKENCKTSNTQSVSDYFNGDLITWSKVYNGTDYFSGWWDVLDNNRICGTYSEEAEGADRGKWRAPNISELAILRMVDVIPKNSGYYMSASYEYFTDRGGGGKSPGYTEKRHNFMGLNDNDISAGIGRDFYLRCVRDVEVE